MVMAKQSGDHAYDVVPQAYHGFLTARTIQITPARVFRKSDACTSSHDQGSSILNLCSELGSELDEICFLMREIENVDCIRRVDGTKLRNSLIRIVEGIKVLVER